MNSYIDLFYCGGDGNLKNNNFNDTKKKKKELEAITKSTVSTRY